LQPSVRSQFRQSAGSAFDTSDRLVDSPKGASAHFYSLSFIQRTAPDYSFFQIVIPRGGERDRCRVPAIVHSDSSGCEAIAESSFIQRTKTRRGGGGEGTFVRRTNDSSSPNDRSFIRRMHDSSSANEVTASSCSTTPSPSPNALELNLQKVISGDAAARRTSSRGTRVRSFLNFNRNPQSWTTRIRSFSEPQAPDRLPSGSNRLNYDHRWGQR